MKSTYIHNIINKDSVILSAFSVYSVKFFLAGAQFALAVVLARLLGVSGYGLYSFAITIASLLMIPAMLGYHGYLVKKVNEFLADEKRLAAGRYVRSILLLTFGVSSLLALGGCVIVYLALWPDRAALSVALFIALGGLPILVALRLASTAIIAVARPVIGTIVGELLRPLLLLAALTPALFAAAYQPDYRIALALTVLSVVACLILALALLRHWLPAGPRQGNGPGPAADTPSYQEWRHAALPFMLSISIAYLNHEVDTVMLGVMIDTDAVGLYRPATRIVALAGFMAVAIGTIMMPTIARLHATGATQDLARLLKTTARLSFLYALIVSAALAIGAEVVLRFFSAEFTQAADALRILLVGVLFAAGVPAGYHLLAMTGFQKLAARIYFWSLVANVVLNLTLIPLLGIEGAATATALTMMIVSASLGWAAYRKTRFDPSAVGLLPSDRQTTVATELATADDSKGRPR